jgi:hypothetical protein
LLLKLNSPVLQRKQGYREVYRVWLMFDLAARLIWTGGDDVYKSGKKDIAVLYEYWLFFKLLELFQRMFQINLDSITNLFQKTRDGLNLQIKQGTHTSLQGVFQKGKRNLNIRFNYNRSYPGGARFPNPGSWTTTLRPDYSLSIWPVGISELDAEKSELIVHIHFDAKYKIENFSELFSQKLSEDLDNEKVESKKGIYKNADLLKMHAYKDAIRRTGGAYVLYPGGITSYNIGFREIIPGLGAFAISPSKTDDGIKYLESFIKSVIEHFENRASQREKIAYKIFENYQYPPNELKENIPEAYGENRWLIPDEAFILIGYYKKQQLGWIIKTQLYNTRGGTGKGSLRMGPNEASARYLLLYSEGENITGRMFRISERGPKVYSKQQLKELDYPTEPSEDYYFIFNITELINNEFSGMKWDITKLKQYKRGIPFSVSLTELMNCKI